MLLHCRVTPHIKVATTHLYTWCKRGIVRVKCLAQEHNAMSLARTWTLTAHSGVEHTNIEATVPPTRCHLWTQSMSSCTSVDRAFTWCSRGHSDFFFVPRLCHVAQFTFDILLFISTHADLDSADPSSMQDACYIWSQLDDRTLYDFS